MREKWQPTKKSELVERYPTSKEDGQGYVYLLGSPNGLVKIGTAIDLASRYIILSHASPVPLIVLHGQIVSDPFRIEHALHICFALYRQHGEWFELSTTQISHAIGLLQDCEELKRHYGYPQRKQLTHGKQEYKGLIFTRRSIGILKTYLADMWTLLTAGH